MGMGIWVYEKGDANLEGRQTCIFYFVYVGAPLYAGVQLNVWGWRLASGITFYRLRFIQQEGLFGAHKFFSLQSQFSLEIFCLQLYYRCISLSAFI